VAGPSNPADGCPEGCPGRRRTRRGIERAAAPVLRGMDAQAPLLQSPPSSTTAPVVGPVALRVADLGRAVGFYGDALGLALNREDGAAAALGAGGRDLILLEERPGAPRPRRSTGLYHLAILLPSRRDLARALRHLAESRVPFQGFADHRVSEAIYLADPEGNGIEVYRDRPREEWIYDGGRLRMATDPLDVDGLMGELAGTGEPEPWTGLPAGTRMGHVHLRVSDLAAAEAFYRDLLGLDVTTRYGNGASFLSKEGYHHHLGLNTWESAGAPPPPEGALGLKSFRLHLPAAELRRIRAGMEERGIAGEETGDGMLLRDPAGNAVELAEAA
jgi:catechol 2,3-dioxygenase